jgi:hypothetical protein
VVLAGAIANQMIGSSAVHNTVGSAVHDAVYGAVGNAVHNTVGSAVRNTVGSAVHDAVYGAVGNAVLRDWSKYLGGQFWVGGWYGGCAYISFFRDVCGLKLPGDLWERSRAYEGTVSSACWWWPHRDYIIVSEHPVAIHTERVPGTTRTRLHCGTDMSVKFGDGWGIWSWHGVRVTEQIILSPETLTAQQIASERNAQIRQVMVERVGVERICQMFHAKMLDQATITIDGVRHPYELLHCTVGTTTFTALKMINPSMGIYHVEYVRGNPQTVREALHQRKPTWMQKIPISEAGLDWYQQGDVYIVPDGAAAIKEFPSRLT